MKSHTQTLQLGAVRNWIDGETYTGLCACDVCRVMLMETNGITGGYVKYCEEITSFSPTAHFIFWKINNLLDTLNIAGAVSVRSGTDVQHCCLYFNFSRFSASQWTNGYKEKQEILQFSVEVSIFICGTYTHNGYDTGASYTGNGP